MTKSIPAIFGIFSIAGASVILTGCNPEATRSFDTAIQALNGGTPLLGSEPVEVTLVAVAEPVVEPEPPAPEPEPPAKVWTCYPFRGTTFCDWL